jgi:long-chain acyl-CoA synthetase
MSDTKTSTERSTGKETLGAMVLAAAERGDDAALRYKDGEEWKDVSYADLGTTVREVARGLIALGIEAGDRVAILSDTKAGWTIADFGVLCAAAVVVPVYHTASAEEAEHVLSDSGARVVFCDNPDRLSTVQEVWDDTDLEHAVLFEGEAEGAITLDALRKKGSDVDEDEVERRLEDVSGDDLFTIIYTSGTTGAPKGCELTHSNYRADMDALEELVELGDETIIFVFLPLAHALTRITQMLTIDVGGTIAFWQGDKDKLIDDLKAVKPTHFPAVPRIFEKIYAQAKGRAEGAVKGKLLEKAIDVGLKVRECERKDEEPGPVLKAEYELADKQILSNVRELFGGRVELALTGAAPVAKEMLEFFYACGVLILEGYGATETSAVVTVNAVDDFRFGTVGKALPNVELKIADENEVWVKGPQVFRGYRNREEDTADSLDDDGWFHTGDLGELDDDGFLRITGRIKEIIVTSSGKNITPSNIENRLSDHPKIEHAIVFGDDRPYLVALLVPDGDLDEDEAQKAIDEANEEFAKIEQIKKFTIADRELSQDEGELTPTMKVKREKVYENFSEQLDGLYDDGDK